MAHQQNATGQRLTHGTARLEQGLRRVGAVLGRVPLRYWRSLVMLLLVIWLAHSLARIFWLAVPEPEIPAARVSQNAVSSASASTGPAVDLASLRDLQVFGRGPEDSALADLPELDEAAPDTGPGIEDEAVDTELQLQLRGVIGSSDEPSARAIIADGENQEIYAIGDELPVGREVTLAKVLGTRVILNNDGRYESLWLYPDGEDGPDLASVGRGASRNDPPARSPEPRSWSGSDAGEADPEQVSRSRNEAAERQRRAAESPESPEEVVDEVAQSLSDVVSLSIHREDGQVAGYRISPGRDSDTFQSLGLEAGDIVTSVNGMPLDNPGNIMEIYRNMSDATSASLQIERDGQPVTVDIDLD